MLIYLHDLCHKFPRPSHKTVIDTLCVYSSYHYIVTEQARFPIVYLMMILYSLALFSIVTTVNTTSLQPFICANMQTYSLRWSPKVGTDFCWWSSYLRLVISEGRNKSGWGFSGSEVELLLIRVEYIELQDMY